jgi:CHASE2 domain-containing sensor protein
LSRLQGKIVLIGATATGLGDRVRTPVSPPGVGSPSTTVIAHMIDMLRHGQPLKDAPPWLQVVLPGLGMLLLLGLLSRQSPRRALVTVALAGALALGGAWLLLRAG